MARAQEAHQRAEQHIRESRVRMHPAEDREAVLLAQIETLSLELARLKAELERTRAEGAPAPKPRVKRKGVGAR